MKRKVHLRAARVITLGHTKTFCGRTIHYAPADTSGAVVSFNGDEFDATVHGTLVTCANCIPGTFANPETQNEQ